MRRLLVLAVLLMIPAFAFAAGESEDGGDGPVTLTIWGRDLPDDDPGHQYHKAVVDLWDGYFEGRVILDYVPGTEVGDKIRVAFAGNEGPDVYQSWGGSTMGGYADAGYLMVLTDELVDIETSDAAREAMSWNGETYGVAPFFAVAGLFLNEGIFEQYGLEAPETIAEMEEVAEVLLENDIQPFALGGQDKWPILAMYMYLTNRYGGYAFNAAQAREISFDSDPFLQAGLIYQDWAQRGYFGSKPLSEDYGTANLLMHTGKAAMQVTGSWMCASHSDPETTDQRIGFYPFPIARGGIGEASDVMGQTDIGWSATKYAEPKRVAVAEFMHYAMSPQVISKDPGRVTSVPGIEAPNRLTSMASEVLGMAEHITFWWDQDLPPELPPPLRDTLQAFFIPDADVESWLTEFEALAIDSLGPVQ